MKSSRAILLAAILFAVPAFADESAKVEDQTEQTTNEPKKEEEKGVFVKARELAVAPFVFVMATAPDYIAQNTLGKIAAIECLKDGKLAAFLTNKWTGRVTVGTVAAVVAYKLWQATQSEDIDADDSDMIFAE